MCGIWCCLLGSGDVEVDEHRDMALRKLSARGPDSTRMIECKAGIGRAYLGFTRLAINGVNAGGEQPFMDKSRKTLWICNGEIYNTKELEQKVGVESKSGSDCEVLGELWKQSGGDAVGFVRQLDGVFALILVDGERLVVARDPYGVRPLYYAEVNNRFYFASERKALEGAAGLGSCSGRYIHAFPPGEVWTIDTVALKTEKQVYAPIPWVSRLWVGEEAALAEVRVALEAAVKKRMLAERPIAALLSGGVDSSLIAALVQREMKAAGGCLKTFSIGMKGSSDLEYARKVAEWIGSEHTEIETTADEMWSVIPEVVRAIESYDITTVRASVGNWMVAREISRRSDCKVVFNGDGSDELFGSYLYFRNAPSDMAYEQEVRRLLAEIHKYDVLRSDRSISSHGLEARTPFLDKQFVAAVLALPVSLRRPMDGRVEKWVLRKAFDSEGLLPPEVLWRRKEAFSDGVSTQEKSWYQEIQERVAASGVGSIESVPEGFPMPPTDEARWYMSLYLNDYRYTGDPWPYWMPRWCPETTDPSARTLNVYQSKQAVQSSS
jgi:asparagine synthase (glutamine-hydrolysing)